MICCPDKSATSPARSTYSSIVEQEQRRFFKMSGTNTVQVAPAFPEQKRSANGRYISADISNPEALGYTLGKTLGSGTYAKVKAAWSPKEKKMVSINIVVAPPNIEPHPLCIYGVWPPACTTPISLSCAETAPYSACAYRAWIRCHPTHGYIPPYLSTRVCMCVCTCTYDVSM